MSSSYDSSRSSRRGVWSHWVPLVLTVTVATVGVAAWAWSQRQTEEEEESPADLDYDNADYGENPPYGVNDSRNYSTSASKADGPAYGVAEVRAEANANAGWGHQMSGALRRTPSPQQFLSNAGKTVAAGVGAVGAAMGSALAAIREEDKNAYADHETWSEEADSRKDTNKDKPPVSRDSGKRRKVVTVVVSADANMDVADDDGFHEHASILSHIPRNTDFSKIKLFVLIYSPSLKDTALDTSASNLPPASLSSSFSNIGHDQVQTPADGPKSPALKSNADPAFNAVYSQALALVEKESMVMPFTSVNGHVHILRHLQPEIIYLQESLAGDSGSFVTQIQSWLRYDVILVVGADGGHGGLADSESEAEKPGKADMKEKWWQREDRVGRGRGIVVVDSLRVGDDWTRRVQGNE